MIDKNIIIRSLINGDKINDIKKRYESMEIATDNSDLLNICDEISDVNKYGVVYTDQELFPILITRKTLNVITAYYLPLKDKYSKLFMYNLYDSIYPYNQDTITDVYSKTVKNDTENNSKYGIEEDNLYPLNNEKEVLEAIRHFKYCPEGKMKELSITINDAIEQFNMSIPLSYTNPFYPLINQSALINSESDDLTVGIETMNNDNYTWGYEKELKSINQVLQDELGICDHVYNDISYMIDYRRYFNNDSIFDTLRELPNITYNNLYKFPKLRKCITDISNQHIFRIKHVTNRFKELFMRRNVEGKDLLFGISENNLYLILFTDSSFILIPLIRESIVDYNLNSILDAENISNNLEIITIDKKNKEPNYNKVKLNDIKIDNDKLLESIIQKDSFSKEDLIPLFILSESNISDEVKLDVRNKFKESLNSIIQEEPTFNFHKYFIESTLLEFLEIGELSNPAKSRIVLTKIMR